MLFENERIVLAQNVPPEKLAEVIDELLRHLNLVLIEEKTPDYTAYEVREKPEGY